MRYAFLVAMREFGEHVKTKGFWIGLFLFPVLLYASFTIPRLLERTATPTRAFAVHDRTGRWTPVIDAAVQAHYDRREGEAQTQWLAKKKVDPSTADYQPRRPYFLRVPLPEPLQGLEAEELRRQARPFLLGDEKVAVEGEPRELFALVVLPPNDLTVDTRTEYWAKNLADDDLQDLVSGAIEEELKRREFLASGLDRERVEEIQEIDVRLAALDPKKEEGKEAVKPEDRIRQWAPAGFVYLLFVSIMTVAQMLLGSTVEEKSNRIYEVLLSSVTPWELMLGKLLGIAAIGITMLAAWIGSAALMFQLNMGGGGGELGGALLNVILSADLLGPFVLYFLLGYLLYAGIFIALGSLCNTQKDAQNFMGPVMMILIVPLLTMVFIVRDPNGTLARVLSYIPPFTPFVMMNRAAGAPPRIDVIGTSVLLLVSVAVVIWLAGRIFRNGILRTGQPPKLLELFRLIRA